MIRSGSILVGVLFTGLGLTAAARAADIEPSLRLPAASAPESVDRKTKRKTKKKRVSGDARARDARNGELA